MNSQLTSNPARYAIRRLLLVVGIFAGFALLACNPGGSQGERAQRPAATSTPDSAVQTPPVRVPARLMVPPTAAEPASDQDSLATLDLRSLTTEQQLARIIAPMRNLRDLALRLDPDVDEIPVVVNAVRPEYEVGDKQRFIVHNLETNSNFEIEAELIHKTDVAYAWVEEGRKYDADRIIASIDRFSEQSYPAETAFFGSEWNPGVDNDPRLHILHAYGLGDGIAGYYSSADEYSRLARDFSNEKEMFYVNLEWLKSSNNYTYYETVLAHEFQHMIHWHNDRNEETWVNEGLSEFAQEIAGYEPDTIFAQIFAQHPDTQLNTWGAAHDDNGVHYGSAYLFMAYFSQRFGAELTRALVAHPANGIGGFDDVLEASGLQKQGRPMRFEDIFADWVVANYTDDPNALGVDGIFGYRNFVQPAPLLDATFDDASYPIDRSTTVANYATDYILLKNTGDIAVEFGGRSSTRLADVDGQSGNYSWWSNRGDDFDTRLTRGFDFRAIEPGEPITMTATMWWDIEEDYDYAYVVASTDGQKWTPLAGQHSQVEDPGGNSFGAGYTARSGVSDDPDGSPGWLTDTFDLSGYAGEQVRIRFEYVTDDAVNNAGWFIDDVSVPALDYFADFENGPDGWQSEGWLLTDNRLEQRWLIQVLELDENRLVGLERPVVDPRLGTVSFEVDDLGNGKTAVLAISALAPVTTERADYHIKVRQRE
ncbi:MAG: hypothetical protein ACK2UO_12095 [Caldilineaceae bacterium]